MAIEIKEAGGIESAAYDLNKAKAFARLAQQVLTAEVGSIKISCNSNNNCEYLCSIENLSDDVIREDLAAFLDRQAERHRTSAQEWLEYGLKGEVSHD